jgi:hypothetical protein
LERKAEVGTDILLKSAIYSYSRSKGLFAGIALDGAVLQLDDDANKNVYGKKTIAADISKNKFAALVLRLCNPSWPLSKSTRSGHVRAADRLTSWESTGLVMLPLILFVRSGLWPLPPVCPDGGNNTRLPLTSIS